MYYLPEHRISEEELGFMIARQTLYPCDKIDVVSNGLDDAQAVAVRNACSSNLSILSGMAGTGKTTVLKSIVKSFIKAGMKGRALCPTGKAAKRFQEVVYDEDGENAINKFTIPASTIHACLGFRDGKFTANENDVLSDDYVLIDETSMCDMQMSNALFRAINWKKTRVVLTGDSNQLPSIGIGNVFYDVLSVPEIPKVMLNRIYRQDINSGIIVNASNVLLGKSLSKISVSGENFTDCSFVISTPERASELIVESVVAGIPSQTGFKSTTDIQVIVPGKRGQVGADFLNKLLRERLNTVKKIQYCGFMVGDKVINKKNDYENNVVNGDVGIVVDINKYGLEVNFGIGVGKDYNGVVGYNAETISRLKLAYAYTVHSSQGSEFPCVVIPIFSTHWMLLFRNLLYTAMTRPRKKLVLYYEPKAIKRCLTNNKKVVRTTNLSKFIDKYIKYFNSNRSGLK